MMSLVDVGYLRVPLVLLLMGYSMGISSFCVLYELLVIGHLPWR